MKNQDKIQKYQGIIDYVCVCLNIRPENYCNSGDCGISDLDEKVVQQDYPEFFLFRDIEYYSAWLSRQVMKIMTHVQRFAAWCLLFCLADTSSLI